jgi:CheY-like chemotaxis protein
VSQIPSPPRPRVVLAEDDTLLLEAFTRLLAPNFEVVGTASDGDEAVSVALRVKPDLVLLDARMPRSSGFEAARRIREQSQGNAPVLVALTGWGQEGDRELSREAGAADVILYTEQDFH